MTDSAIKVGMIAEQTGPLSFMGCANGNVAKMVIDDINASGGLLGRKLDLYLEDGATTDSVAEVAATKLVRQDKVRCALRRHLQLDAPGDQRPRRRSRARRSTSTPSSTKARSATR